MGRKKKINKEELAEDCCFYCKDGGKLRICDYEDCLKAYHPSCVEKDDSFLEDEEPWTCMLHKCFICKKSSKFTCFCCSTALCGHCLCSAEFAVVKGKKGFCAHCLTLTSLVEGVKAPDPNEGAIDFSDKDTYEYTFMCYWKVVKEKEGLSVKHINRAQRLLHKNKNYGNSSDSDDAYELEDSLIHTEDENQVSDYDDAGDTDNDVCKRKRNKGKPSLSRGKVQSKTDFNGWGSKPLFDFLTAVGKSPEKELSQHEVANIIMDYCREQNLFHQEKKKKILCDAKLQSLLGRKLVTRNGLYKLLSSHFAENFEQSEDELSFGLEDEEREVVTGRKKHKMFSPDKKSQKKEVLIQKKSGFAAVVADNIRLVYLKKSLVFELSKRPQLFVDKVIGSFVRVKTDPYDYFQKNSHQLFQVMGIKRTSGSNGMGSKIFLQVSFMLRDVSINELSEDNFTEEECLDLRTRIKNGQLRRPTIVEIEQKARILHEDITKHRISRELSRLQSLINQANEKGWRKEHKLADHIDRMLLLKTPEEQARLLHEIHGVIADEADDESSCKDLPSNDEPKCNCPKESAREEGGDIDHLDFAPGINGSGFNSEEIQNGEDLIENDENDEKGTRDSAHSSSSAAMMKDGEKEPCVENDEKDVNGVATRLSDINSKSSPGLEVSGFCGESDHLSKEEPRGNSEDVKRKSVAVNQSHSEANKRNKQVNANKDGGKKKTKINLRDDEKANASKDGGGKELTIIELSDNGKANASKHGDKIGTIIELSDEKSNASKKDGEKRHTIIELSDGDEEQNTYAPKSHETRPASSKAQENPNDKIWHYISPTGLMNGPYPMRILKKWSETNPYNLQFKVWKTDQRPEEAVLLEDAIRLVFHRSDI